MRSLLNFQPSQLRQLSEEEMKQFAISLKADQQDAANGKQVLFDLDEYLTKDQGLTKGTDEYALLAHPFRVFLHTLHQRGAKTTTKPLGNYVVYLTGGNLAELVMYAHALHLGTSGQELVTMDDLVRLFPHGIPTEEAMRIWWDKTKTISAGGDGSRSALDFGTAWVIPE